jgi:hypothetical protein
MTSISRRHVERGEGENVVTDSQATSATSSMRTVTSVRSGEKSLNFERAEATAFS